MAAAQKFRAKLFPPVTKDKFAALMSREIRRNNPDAKPEYDPTRFRISDRAGHFLYLDNAYAEYLIVPIRGRRDIFKRYASLASQSTSEQELGSFDSVKQDLLPKVRERFYHAFNTLHFQVAENKPLDVATRPLSEDLTLELVHDTPTSMKLIPQHELDKWGVTFEQAMQIARDNLWKRSNENFLSPRPGLYMSPWNDSNGASRIALHDLIWQLKVKGDHVAAIPNRDLLMVTGSEDTEGLLTMAGLIKEAMALPRFMTAAIMRLNGTKWESYLPPAANPAHELLRALYVEGLAREYSQQKEVLDKLYHEKTGRDVFVASVSLYLVGDDKRLVSRTSWLGGIDSLLPRVDELMIGQWDVQQNKANTLGMVQWDKLCAVAPGLLVPEPGLYPARFQANAIPTAEQLALAGMAPLKSQA